MTKVLPYKLNPQPNPLITETAKQKSDTIKQAYDLVVFSHLRWDFVYQRPQHIIERLSKYYRVLFIEEPCAPPAGKSANGTLTKINDRLNVLKPHTETITDLPAVFDDFITSRDIDVGWFYSGAFVQLADNFNFKKVVYDCMDELTLFKGASVNLLQQENKLLEKADVVFTGGKRLFEAKHQKHGNVYCFPSSVDVVHFSQALNGIAVPEDIQFNKPVVGYYGVIDERIDLHLIKAVAELLPNVQFVMVGPLAKISEADLPKLPNIYYTGMRTYNTLPAYLKGFDVAMMPFAINDATKFISPTKTLEYMAAYKPIISTPIYDVERDYKSCVHVVNNAHEFANAIKGVLAHKNEGIQPFSRDYAQILRQTSWDKTVKAMHQIICSL